MSSPGVYDSGWRDAVSDEHTSVAPSVRGAVVRRRRRGDTRGVFGYEHPDPNALERKAIASQRSDEVVSDRIPRRTADETEGANGSKKARRSIATTTVCRLVEPLLTIHLVLALPAPILRS